MKSIFYTFFLLLNLTNLSAQITVTNAYFPSAGDTLVTTWCLNSEYKNLWGDSQQVLIDNRPH